MYARNDRSELDALRAELDQLWLAPDFDIAAYAACIRALEAALPAREHMASERRSLAGHLGAIARWGDQRK